MICVAGTAFSCSVTAVPDASALEVRASPASTAALVLFSLDTVGLLVITFTLLEDPILNLVDIIFHALAVYELVMAVICAGKLKRQAAAETYSTTPDIY